MTPRSRLARWQPGVLGAWLFCLIAMPSTAAAGELDELVQAARAEETPQLQAQAKRIVQRQGAKLHLGLRNGTRRTLSDVVDPEAEASFELYVWRGLRAGARYHEVSRQLYEEREWLWVDRVRGRTWAFGERPELSPDEAHLAVSTVDTAYMEPGLWIYALHAQGPRLVLALEERQLRLVRWGSPRQLWLEEIDDDASCKGERARPRALLRSGKGVWRLAPPAAAWQCRAATVFRP